MFSLDLTVLTLFAVLPTTLAAGNMKYIRTAQFFFHVFLTPLTYKETHFEGNDFIIVVGSSPWKLNKAKQYCKTILPTFYDLKPSTLYSINSWEKQSAVSKVAFENNIRTKAWIGLTDELSEGTWYWQDGEPTNDFYFWRSGSTPPNGTDKHASMIRFDLFGYGWDPISKVRKVDAIICSHR